MPTHRLYRQFVSHAHYEILRQTVAIMRPLSIALGMALHAVDPRKVGKALVVKLQKLNRVAGRTRCPLQIANLRRHSVAQREQPYTNTRTKTAKGVQAHPSPQQREQFVRACELLKRKHVSVTMLRTNPGR